MPAASFQKPASGRDRVLEAPFWSSLSCLQSKSSISRIKSDSTCHGRVQFACGTEAGCSLKLRESSITWRSCLSVVHFGRKG